MSSKTFRVQNKTLFSKSLIWQLNKDFYQEKGIAAWSDGIVPHELTNSALAATSYAELIFAFLKDLESETSSGGIVYILELGAGHGRLCFNILKHLDELVALDDNCTAKYCYVLSDIVEENLSFLSEHPQLQEFYESGVLDVCFFDATETKELHLRKSKIKIESSQLNQPILAIANYFFDSIPNELFYFQNKSIFNCSIALDSPVDPEGSSAQEMISNLEMTIHRSPVEQPIYKNEIFNEILSDYLQVEGENYILFPKKSMECLDNISDLSKTGLLILSLDKGYKEIQEFVGRAKPDLVKHGSFSFWVNFHAMAEFCKKKGGASLFDSSTNQSIELACMFFMKQPFNYILTKQMYHKHARQINLDDFNSLKKFVYKNIPSTNLSELLALVRLSSYDSTIFINLLPHIKQLAKSISIKQRTRLKQTINHIWRKHYVVNKKYDLSYELGGLLYDLGYYQEALDFFDSSREIFGHKIDVNYNQILCYFQLRQDQLFYKALKEAKLRFPTSDAFLSLESLDMN